MRELWKEEPLLFCAHAGAGPGALWLPARPPSGGSVSCVSPAPRLGRSATFSEAGVSVLAAVCGVVALHAAGGSWEAHTLLTGRWGLTQSHR